MVKKITMLFSLVILITCGYGKAVAAPVKLEKVKIYNHTENQVYIRLTNENGILKYVDLPVDQSTMALETGIYEFYAVTECGNQFGTWNVNRTKELHIRCKDDRLSIQYFKTCPQNPIYSFPKNWGTYYLIPELNVMWLFFEDSPNGADWLQMVYGYDVTILNLGEGCWSDKADFGWFRYESYTHN